MLISFTAAQANDGGGQGEKKEEGGQAAEPVKESVKPWVPIEAKIQELSSRIRSKKESLEKLLEEKNHLPANSPHVKETLKQILKEHAELKQAAEDYQKNVNQLNYRFPERNAKAKRSYDRIEVKSIDEMEQAMGVDGKLSRNVKKMRSQYHGDKQTEDTHNEKSLEPKKENKPKSIEDDSAIIINK